MEKKEQSSKDERRPKITEGDIHRAGKEKTRNVKGEYAASIDENGEKNAWDKTQVNQNARINSKRSLSHRCKRI